MHLSKRKTTLKVIILLLLSKKLMILKKVVTEGPMYKGLNVEGIQPGKVKHPRVRYSGKPLPPFSRFEEMTKTHGDLELQARTV